MICPVCKSREQKTIILHSEGFAAHITECRICGTIWSINHGALEIIRDTQEHSFLEALTECVEGDDYYLVA